MQMLHLDLPNQKKYSFFAMKANKGLLMNILFEQICCAFEMTKGVICSHYLQQL